MIFFSFHKIFNFVCFGHFPRRTKLNFLPSSLAHERKKHWRRGKVGLGWSSRMAAKVVPDQKDLGGGGWKIGFYIEIYNSNVKFLKRLSRFLHFRYSKLNRKCTNSGIFRKKGASWHKRRQSSEKEFSRALIMGFDCFDAVLDHFDYYYYC